MPWLLEKGAQAPCFTVHHLYPQIVTGTAVDVERKAPGKI